jgi:hypothetical protein
MSLSYVITAILAFCSCISPIITAIVNNLYKIKMRKMEIAQEAKKETIYYQRGIFEKYMSLVSTAVMSASDDARSEYANIYPVALAYSPDSLHNKMRKLNDLIALPSAQNRSESIRLINEIIPEIRKVIDRL